MREGRTDRRSVPTIRSVVVSPPPRALVLVFILVSPAPPAVFVVVIFFDAPCPIPAVALPELPPVLSHLHPVDDPADEDRQPEGQVQNADQHADLRQPSELGR